MIYKKLAKTVKLCRFYQDELLIYHACASNTCAVPTEQKNIFASNYWPWQSKKKLGVNYFKIEKKNVVILFSKFNLRFKCYVLSAQSTKVFVFVDIKMEAVFTVVFLIICFFFIFRKNLQWFWSLFNAYDTHTHICVDTISEYVLKFIK